MSEISLRKYKNLLGDTKEIIAAIQKYIKENEPVSYFKQNEEGEEAPAASVNRILDSVASDEINNDIQKIINNL